jgi:hypothetical protein
MAASSTRYLASQSITARGAKGAPGSRTAPVFAMVVLIAAAAVVGFAVTNAQTSAAAVAEAGADLVRLMRGMALIKLSMAALAGGAVLWRLLAAPIRAGWFAAYAVACAAMAAGPGLIWHMDAVRTGAALLHGGLLAAVILVWRDAAVDARLAEIIAARRARLSPRIERNDGGIQGHRERDPHT